MASIKDVMAALEMPAGEFSREWKRLTDADKEDIKQWVDDENRSA